MGVIKPLQESMVREFFKFVHERQKIWYKRFVLKEPFPWTNDEILQKTHFCNVYRELDKGTIALIKKVNEYNLDRKELLFNVVAYRFFNSITWLEEVFPFRIGFDLEETYQKIKSLGKTVFNIAYLTCSSPFIRDKNPKDKLYQNLARLKHLETLLDDWIKRIDESFKPEEPFLIFQELNGVSTFLAYEIWTDLTYFNFFKQGWTDDDFVNIGPGAIWGLALMSGLENPEGRFKEGYKGLGVELTRWLRDTQKYWFNKLYQEGEIEPQWEVIAYKESFSNSPYLSLRNIEHSLCEFRKYWRRKQGKGRFRKFTPDVEYWRET